MIVGILATVLMAGMSIAAVGLLGGVLACGGFRSVGEAYEGPELSGSVVIVTLANVAEYGVCS